jgi:hypothetical protein
MTKEYVQLVGRMAYLWGWALMNNAHRHEAFSRAPEPGEQVPRVAMAPWRVQVVGSARRGRCILSRTDPSLAFRK